MKRKYAITAAIGLGALSLGAITYLSVITDIISGRRKDHLEHPGKKISESKQKLIDASLKIKALPMTLVTMKNRSGMQLFGHWYPYEGAERTVILVHGWHGAWHQDFSGIAPFLHDAKCNLLLIEQRCHNSSDGKLISYGILERYDVEDWVSYTRENLSALPLYLYGMSMGASTVLMASVLPGCADVKGIISDCGFTSPHEIISLTVKRRVGRELPITLAAVGKLCHLRANFRYKDYSTVDALKQNTNIPMLFIHGDEDDFVPCEMTYQNYLACAAPKEILIVKGANHGRCCVVDAEAYQKKVLDFIKACDKRTICDIPIDDIAVSE